MLHFLYWPDRADPRLPPEHLARQLAALADAGFATSPLPDGVLNGQHALKGVPQGATVVYRGPLLSLDDYRQLVRAIVEVGAQPLTTADRYAAACRLSAWHPKLQSWCTPAEPVADWQQLPTALAKLPWPTAQLWSDFGPVLGTRGTVRPADMTDPAEVQALLDDVRQSLPPEVLSAGLYLRRPAPREALRQFIALSGKPLAADGGEIPACVLRAAEQIDNPFFAIEVVDSAGDEPRIHRITDGQTAEIYGWTAERLANIWK
jgi:hypothetical protein